MTKYELADIVSLTACVLEGLVTGGSARSVGDRARRCIRHTPEVRAAVLGYLESLEEDKEPSRTAAGLVAGRCPEVPVAPVSESPTVDTGVLLERARGLLATRALRQNQIERELGVGEGMLDGLLTEANGFDLVGAGWVRVKEPVVA